MPAVALTASIASVAGFLVTFVWARALHRRHRLADRWAAIAPALMGGALGSTCVLLIVAAQHTTSLAI